MVQHKNLNVCSPISCHTPNDLQITQCGRLALRLVLSHVSVREMQVQKASSPPGFCEHTTSSPPAAGLQASLLESAVGALSSFNSPVALSLKFLCFWQLNLLCMMLTFFLIVKVYPTFL